MGAPLPFSSGVFPRLLQKDITGSYFFLEFFRQESPVVNVDQNGNVTFSECRSEAVDFRAGFIKRGSYVEQDQDRFLHALFLKYGCHTPRLEQQERRCEEGHIRLFLSRDQEKVHAVSSLSSSRCASTRASSMKFSTCLRASSTRVSP